MNRIIDLYPILDKYIFQLKEKILLDLNEFISSGKEYRNIQYQKDFCVLFKKGGNEQIKLIGFPFPLLLSPILFTEIRDVSIYFFLRGEPIRKLQRDLLIEELKLKGKEVEYKEIDSIEQFRRITLDICSKFREFDYYDPYSFIGDSIIGLHFPEEFKHFFNINLDRIFSENYLNIMMAGKSFGYVDALKNTKNLAIFSDLIENQWDRTKYLVKSLAIKNIPSIIIGRNLIIIPDGETIQIFHFFEEDHLLREENIEDYMNSCLNPFLNPITFKHSPKKVISNNLVINPFGSESLKTLSVDMVNYIIQSYKKYHPEAKILVIAGFKNSYSHLCWCADLKNRIGNESYNKDILFKNFGSFSEIIENIQRYDISLGVTADTSITHLFNYLGIRNATIFNLQRCDILSKQSLCSDSPLGFCRYGPIQYPVLLTKENEREIEKAIVDFLLYFTKFSQNLEWIDKIYDEKILLKNVSSKQLSHANEKINPKYKIKNDKID